MWQDTCFDGGLRGTPPKGNKRSNLTHELRRMVWVMKKQSGVTIVEVALILGLFGIVAVSVFTSFPPIEPKKTPLQLVAKEAPLPNGGNEKPATAPFPIVVSQVVAAPQ
jgi:hypothetical protein